MVAAISSGRIGGGGGVVVKVRADTSELVSSARQDVAALEKELKLRPKLDFEEGAFVSGMRGAINKIQRAAAQQRIGIELEAKGLGDIARQLGIIKTEAKSAAVDVGKIGTTGIQGEIIKNIAQRRAAMAAGAQQAPAEASPLNDLADAIKSAKRGGGGASGAMGLGGVVRAGLYGAAAAGATQLAGSGIAYYNASAMAGMNNGAGQLAGRIGQQAAMNDLPVVGRIAKLIDDSMGITRGLRAQVEAMGDIRSARVEAAQISHSRSAAVEAEGEERLAGMRDKYAQQGIEIGDGPGGAITAQSEGKATKRAVGAAAYAYSVTKANNEARIARTREEVRAEQDVTRAETKAEGMRVNQPNEAERVEMEARGKAEASLADPAMQELIQKRNAAKMAAFNQRVKRSESQNAYRTVTDVGVAEMRTAHRGESMADDQALEAIRDAQYDIDYAPDEGGAKGLAKARGIARLRTMKAGLAVKSGGTGFVANLSTDVLGDPYGLHPEEKARARGLRMIDNKLESMGGSAMAADTGIRSFRDLIGKNGMDATKDKSDFGAMLKLLEVIADGFGKAAVLK